MAVKPVFSASAIPKLDAVGERLEHFIQDSLDKYQFRNAIFLAERLRSHVCVPGHSEEEREYARFLLATSHYRQGSPVLAWSILQESSSTRGCFLLAQCCLDLRRYIECTDILERLLESNTLIPCRAIDSGPRQAPALAGEPDKAAVLNLLGHSARAQKRHRHAIKYFEESSKLNPFLWDAFENLCELGAPPDPNHMFTSMGPQTSVFGANLNHSGRVVLPIKQRARTLGNEKLFGFSTKQGSTLGGNSDRPAFTLSKPADFILNKPNFAAPLVSSNRGVVGIMGSPTGEEPVDYLGEKFPSNISSNQSALNTQAAPAAIDTTAASSGATERVPLKRGASMARRTYDRTKSSSALPSLSNKRRLERSSTAMGLPDMRESKTLQQSLLNTTGAISETSEERDKERERDRDNKDVTSRRTEVEAWQDSAALQNMTDIFRNMARACGSFSIHKYADALAQFGKLPFTYLNSGWVQCQIAKCKFEISSFEDAAKHFEMARALEPHMHRDMDLYSSCLWHLKKETALSTLAKDLKDSDNQSHVAWVALGNAYNLRQEHEQALHCFQRAIQLNDRYAYAHTLAGQEYYALDEHDKAQAEYQLAMTINPRYFFPWYGMGQIYGKMGKNDLSLVYYQEAQKLNPSNGVLVYQLGMIQEKLDRLDDARLSYKRAINIHPSNVVARFRLAKLLADMGQMLEAIEELERVKNLAPSEPKVYMLLGKILDKMGNQEESLKYLTWALDLDSKSSHEIQGLIDKVNNGSEEQDNNYDYIMND